MADLDTLSVLFTDMVGSTVQRAALGDDLADDLQRVHDALVAHAVAEHGGTLIKNLGDGALATFAAAADAVSAAIAVQQAVHHHNRTSADAKALAVRIGVSVGDVTTFEGDVLGSPVVEASRLCSVAGGGEILVAELVRLLARGRGGFVFEPVGELELKGLPEPVPACRVPWEPLTATEASGEGLPLPALLLGAPTIGYVGRAALLAELDAALRVAVRGGCRTMLLAGEPGIGKTRTAAEAARRAHDDGALVLYGRCDEALGVPYQPFVEMLDFYTSECAEPHLGRLPGELARLVPDLGQRISALPPAVASDPRSEEHRLFEAVASWLARASSDSGLVVVIDDLHWAAQSTLQLLVHVLRNSAADGSRARLLVIGTYRDTDIDRRHALSGVLADLRRLPGVERVAVEGLDAEEVAAFAEESAGHELDEPLARLAREVHAETEGNPFFVGEVLRHLVETGAVRRVADRWQVADVHTVDVPEGVRDVVGRRVGRLSDAANAALSAAAVIGREVTLDIVSAVTDLDDEALLDAVDEGVRARLLEELGVDEYRFSHALVRTTLYEELSATRKRRLHRRVVDALEKLRGDDVVSLAHHSVEAGDSPARAIRYLVAAGDEALAARALAQAETSYVHAIDLLEDINDCDDELNEVVLAARCGLGEAQRDQGDQQFRATLLEASHRALESGSLPMLVRSVLANDRSLSLVGLFDDERVAMIERALELVPDDVSQDRAKLLALLAQEVSFGDHQVQRAALTGEAEAMARQLGDPGTLAYVVSRTGYAALSSVSVAANLARSMDGVQAADTIDDPGLRILTRVWLNAAQTTLGLWDEQAATLRQLAEIAHDASPTLAWIARSIPCVQQRLMRGDFAEASDLADELFALGQQLGEPDALAWWAAMQGGLSYYRGDFSNLADQMGAFASMYPLLLTWQTGYAWSLAEAGRIEEASAVAATIDLPRLLREPFPYFGHFQLAAISRRLGDAALASDVLAALTPYRGLWAHYIIVVGGPIELALAMAAAGAGQLDQSVQFFEEAQRLAPRDRFPAMADNIEIEFAELLAERARDDDHHRALELLDRVERSANGHDSHGLMQRARAVRQGLTTTS